MGYVHLLIYKRDVLGDQTSECLLFFVSLLDLRYKSELLFKALLVFLLLMFLHLELELFDAVKKSIFNLLLCSLCSDFLLHIQIKFVLSTYKLLQLLAYSLKHDLLLRFRHYILDQIRYKSSSRCIDILEDVVYLWVSFY